MAKNNENENLTINLIGTGTIIKGDIKSNGDIRIDGTLIGSLESKGKVVVGPTGNIEGEVNCQNADISGIVKAQVTVAELVTLKTTAKLTGDLLTNKLAIEPGANFSGTCNMNAPSKQFGEIKNVIVKEKTEPPKVETTI
ncbi:MAG: polymer-forming cytoskeletal protein [Bacteroidales bacterium]|nr:polymer-forming cytoskeletal protein [Bacteroidales bacterium]